MYFNDLFSHHPTEHTFYYYLFINTITFTKKIVANAQKLSQFCKYDPFSEHENARQRVLAFDWATKLEKNENIILDDRDLVETIESIKILWSDSKFRGILEFRGQAGKFQIDCNVEYFMERIDRIFSENYIPTDDEYFRFRMRTTGVSEEKFEIATPPSKELQTFIFIDVGGQRAERRKWLTLITDQIKSVVYICAISEFDMVCYIKDWKRRKKKANKIQKTKKNV